MNVDLMTPTIGLMDQAPANERGEIMEDSVIPSYRPELFIGREEMIKENIQPLFEKVRKRETAFRGVLIEAEYGSGKTWLALQLMRTIFSKTAETRAFFLCLKPNERDLASLKEKNEYYLNPVDSTTSVDQKVGIFIRWLAEQLAISFLIPPGIREMSKKIIDTVQSSQETIVFVLDSAYEADPEIVKSLESHLLFGLAGLSNVFFVITGRGRRFVWQSPDLSNNMLGLRLERFSEPEIDQILEKQSRQKLDDKQKQIIYQASGGWPLAALNLAASSNPVHEASQMIDEMLPRRAEDPYPIRGIFEALSPLERFREDLILPMLVTYYQERGDTEMLAQVRQWTPEILREKVMGDWLNTNMLRFKQGSYEMDETLQSLLHFYLQNHETDRKLWELLNQTALTIHQNTAQKFQTNPRISQYFQDQAAIYQKRLDNARKTGGAPTTGHSGSRSSGRSLA